MSFDPSRVAATLGVDAIATVELDGGMIGTVHRVDLADGRSVVAKTGNTPLSVEARMLRYLDDRGLPVPAVLAADDDLLVLSFVPGESRITPSVERDLADHLAALHERGADAFGFPFDTLTGSVEQPNPWTDRWPEFYAEHRVGNVLGKCRDEGAIDDALAGRVRAVVDRVRGRLPASIRPALIHGDVWTGNLVTDGESVRAFLDPACYYAHDEVELAYLDWTDAVGDPFFERYRTRRGIADGFFEWRRFVYRLYPLLVHLLLFGEPYGEELSATLDRIEDRRGGDDAE